MSVILTPEQMTYASLIDYGKVTVEMKPGGTCEVLVEGFKFGEPVSCREHAVKGMAWARDVIIAAIENDRIVPGGHIVSAVD